MIIARPGDAAALEGKSWTFVYGRRKTGKTFLVEHFTDHDEFFFVKRDMTILLKGDWKNFDYDAFIEILRRDLEAGKTVVVDEFHRLGEDFLDILHSMPRRGRLIVISSAMHTAKLFIDKSSPILGKFAEANIGLINLGDCLNALPQGARHGLRRRTPGRASLKETAETAVIIREPITIDVVEAGGIYHVLNRFSLTVSALMGEVFSEEDRKLTRTYEGIIRAVAVGKSKSGEISSFLFSRRLISKDDPSLIQQYLNNLVNLGILKKVPVWQKNRFFYFHTSPLTRIYHYLDEKYSIGDRTVSQGEMETLMRQAMPRVMEQALREMMADLFGMKLFLHEAPDFEVDGILVRFKKPEIAFEVKWKDRVDGADIRKAEENLERLGVKRKLLIVPEKRGLRSGKLEIMDVGDLMDIYNGLYNGPGRAWESGRRDESRDNGNRRRGKADRRGRRQRYDRRREKQ